MASSSSAWLRLACAKLEAGRCACDMLDDVGEEDLEGDLDFTGGTRCLVSVSWRDVADKAGERVLPRVEEVGPPAGDALGFILKLAYLDFVRPARAPIGRFQ